MQNRTLLVFNLELDLDSQVLASSHDWVSEFAKKYEEVLVYTTHSGRTKLPKNVSVVQIGGGSFPKRILAVFRLFKSLKSIYRDRKKIHVFHHMSTRSLLLVGTVIRIMKVPQILWYSHSIADLPLKLCQSVPNLIVSSNLDTVPVSKNSKVRAIGHGIEVSRFKEEKDLLSQKREGIIALGRIVPVKNLEKLLEVITILTPKARAAIGDIKFIGPSGINQRYEIKLNKIISENSLNVSFLGGLSYTKIPEILESTSILFSGTPQSVDKVCLEAAMSGCLIVSDNSSVQELTGMRKLFPTEIIRRDLQLQLEWILELSEMDITELRREVIRESRSSNSLDSLVLKVTSLFEEIEASYSLE